jgi:hypothetical protein
MPSLTISPTRPPVKVQSTETEIPTKAPTVCEDREDWGFLMSTSSKECLDWDYLQSLFGKYNGKTFDVTDRTEESVSVDFFQYFIENDDGNADDVGFWCVYGTTEKHLESSTDSDGDVGAKLSHTGDCEDNGYAEVRIFTAVAKSQFW